MLAIDFGTSFTVAAVKRPGQAAEVIEIDGDRRVPSAVFSAEDGTVFVGRAAEDHARFQPGRFLRAPKIRIGDKASVILGGRPFQIVDLVASILGHVRLEAERHMGSTPSEVRLTHPATWSRSRQATLLDAAERASLPNPVLVPEPVAAAMAYADEAGVRRGEHVLVYDLGGGTFDTAVLRAGQDGFVVIGRPLGEAGLGGELFDEIMANLIGERLDPDAWQALAASEQPEWQRAAVALRVEARRAKEALSSQRHTDVLVTLPTGTVQQRVTRADLETEIRPYVTDSVDLLHRALEDADISVADVNAIYLAGGGSRTPLVHEVLAASFPGTLVSHRGDPKLAIALGATHENATRSDVAITTPATSIDTAPPTPAPLAAPPPVLPPPPAGAPATAPGRPGPIDVGPVPVGGSGRRGQAWLLPALTLAFVALALVGVVALLFMRGDGEGTAGGNETDQSTAAPPQGSDAPVSSAAGSLSSLTSAPTTTLPPTTAEASTTTLGPTTTVAPTTLAPATAPPVVTTEPPPSTTRTTAAPPPVPPLSSPLPPGPEEFDLGHPEFVSQPPCDGRYITSVGSAINPNRYRAQVGDLLGRFPAAHYLFTASTCRSLDPTTVFEGQEVYIYVVYLGPFDSAEDACEAAQGLDDYFVRRLDGTNPDAATVEC